jgi:nitroreductase
MAPNDDSFYEAIRSLRVVRAFRPEPIPEKVLAEILDAGRWTGSSKNRQGWAFVVVVDGRDHLASAGSFTDPIRASVTTIALVRTDERNDFDIGRVAQNLMLAAATRGVGSCPVTLHDTDRARVVLGIPPGAECHYAIALGYPDQEREGAQRAKRRSQGFTGRKAIEQIVHREVWGS